MGTRVSSKLVAYIDSHQGLAAYKDTQFAYQYSNSAYATLIGLSHPQDLIGRTVFDIPCDAVSYAQEFDVQDRQVMSSGQTLRILNIQPFADGRWGIYLCTKRPWFNEGNEVVGSIGEAVDITDAYTSALSTRFARVTGQKQHSLILTGADTVGRTNAGMSLSPRESEVLFLILRGKTAKLAAEVLSISFRTVEQHLESIKFKFGARNKAELIDAAIDRGYLNHIPLSIFSRRLSVGFLL